MRDMKMEWLTRIQAEKADRTVTSYENGNCDSKRNISAIPLIISTDANLERANEEVEDLVGGGHSGSSNDLNHLRDATRVPEIPPQGGATPARTVNVNNDNMSSELEEVRKIFRNFLQKYGENFSLLVRMLGKEATLDKFASEKRTGLNGELKKLSNSDCW